MRFLPGLALVLCLTAGPAPLFAQEDPVVEDPSPAADSGMRQFFLDRKSVV